MTYPTGQLGGDLSGNPVTQGNEKGFILSLILGALQNGLGLGPSGGGIVSKPQSVATNVVNLAAGNSQVIPVGAKGWTVACMTGTITIAVASPGSGSAGSLPAGLSTSDPSTTTAAITITTASASTAFIQWGS